MYKYVTKKTVVQYFIKSCPFNREEHSQLALVGRYSLYSTKEYLVRSHHSLTSTGQPQGTVMSLLTSLLLTTHLLAGSFRYQTVHKGMYKPQDTVPVAFCRQK